jgi:hypothetical protein
MASRTRAGFGALGALACLLCGCRADMQDTPRANTFRPSRFFDDHLSARQLVAGTVPATGLAEDELRYNGRVDGRLVTVFPFPVTREVLERGQERFNIFCSPCHGRLGDGDGMVVQRGLRRPPSYHIDRLRKAPVGHFYDVITHGFGSMYDYADRVPPRDRWCIVAYIRALQLSQDATLADVPARERSELEGVRK